LRSLQSMYRGAQSLYRGQFHLPRYLYWGFLSPNRGWSVLYKRRAQSFYGWDACKLSPTVPSGAAWAVGAIAATWLRGAINDFWDTADGRFSGWPQLKDSARATAFEWDFGPPFPPRFCSQSHIPINISSTVVVYSYHTRRPLYCRQQIEDVVLSWL